jgi:hypothetical protein
MKCCASLSFVRYFGAIVNQSFAAFLAQTFLLGHEVRLLLDAVRLKEVLDVFVAISSPLRPVHAP